MNYSYHYPKAIENSHMENFVKGTWEHTCAWEPRNLTFYEVPGNTLVTDDIGLKESISFENKQLYSVFLKQFMKFK